MLFFFLIVSESSFWQHVDFQIIDEMNFATNYILNEYFFTDFVFEVDRDDNVLWDLMFVDFQISNVQWSCHSSNDIMSCVNFYEISIRQSDAAVCVETNLCLVSFDW